MVQVALLPAADGDGGPVGGGAAGADPGATRSSRLGRSGLRQGVGADRRRAGW